MARFDALATRTAARPAAWDWQVPAAVLGPFWSCWAVDRRDTDSLAAAHQPLPATW